ncbi:hypothetical protein KBD45_04470 [Candidatus Dojkabacteria bacterium]|nr:hypothetical protein [Candidatus Dojkabacteria bacterium]
MGTARLIWQWRIYFPTLSQFLSISLNYSGIQSEGQLYCWGYNVDGQSNVPPGLTYAKSVTTGGYHTCAIDNNNQLSCWGRNMYGQLNIPGGFTGF